MSTSPHRLLPTIPPNSLEVVKLWILLSNQLYLWHLIIWSIQQKRNGGTSGAAIYCKKTIWEPIYKFFANFTAFIQPIFFNFSNTLKIKSNWSLQQQCCQSSWTILLYLKKATHSAAIILYLKLESGYSNFKGTILRRHFEWTFKYGKKTILTFYGPKK